MILEGVVTSLGRRGEVNIAPMGAAVDESMKAFELRPFKSTRTFANLKRHPEGVFHVIDDVLLLAQAAIGQLAPSQDTFSAEKVSGSVLKSACRWYEFRIERFDEGQDRAVLDARVIHSGRLRDFFGFNRAKHAVVEAAILATRVHLLPEPEMLERLDALQILVNKTAGPREIKAFELLRQHVEERNGPGARV